MMALDKCFLVVLTTEFQTKSEASEKLQKKLKKNSRSEAASSAPWQLCLTLCHRKKPLRRLANWFVSDLTKYVMFACRLHIRKTSQISAQRPSPGSFADWTTPKYRFGELLVNKHFSWHCFDIYIYINYIDILRPGRLALLKSNLKYVEVFVTTKSTATELLLSRDRSGIFWIQILHCVYTGMQLAFELWTWQCCEKFVRDKANFVVLSQAVVAYRACQICCLPRVTWAPYALRSWAWRWLPMTSSSFLWRFASPWKKPPSWLSWSSRCTQYQWIK